MSRIAIYICEIIGHKWNKRDPYVQKCSRCGSTRHHMYSRINHMKGLNALSWRIEDPKPIKLK